VLGGVEISLLNKQPRPESRNQGGENVLQCPVAGDLNLMMIYVHQSSYHTSSNCNELAVEKADSLTQGLP